MALKYMTPPSGRVTGAQPTMKRTYVNMDPGTTRFQEAPNEPYRRPILMASSTKLSAAMFENDVAQYGA
jgi:hypothetical protein